MIYSSVFVLAGFAFWGLLKGYPFLGVFLIFVIHPLLDFVFRHKKISDVSELGSFVAEKLIYLAFPVSFALIGLLLWQSSQWETWPQALGSILTTGVLMGVIAINTAHEFIHREHAWERALGVGQLMLVNFAQFRINHVDIHHRWVGTPRDPTTARRGENLYRYWLRSYLGGWREAWIFENERMKNEKLHFWQHRLLHYSLGTLSGSVLIYFVFGPQALLFWWAVSLIAILLLQTVDYVEHYGLRRQELKPGVFEAIKPRHSWDSYTIMTNAVLFNLGIHSHHHTRSQLHFTELKASEGIAGGGRELPQGYAVMVLCAFVPPLWQRIMNWRLSS